MKKGEVYRRTRQGVHPFVLEGDIGIVEAELTLQNAPVVRMLVPRLGYSVVHPKQFFHIYWDQINDTTEQTNEQ